MAKLIEMTGRKRDRLAAWIGKMRKVGADDAMILEFIQDTHRRWVCQDAEIAEPVDWISGCVKARLKTKAKASGAVPDVEKWDIDAILAKCNEQMVADSESAWPGFKVMLAEALNAGADPERHVYPACKRAVRKGLANIESAGWFAFAINGLRTGVARNAA